MRLHRFKPVLRCWSRLATLLLAIAGPSEFAAAAFTFNQQQFINANPGLNVMDFEGIAPVGQLVRFDGPREGVTIAGGRSFSTMDPRLIDVADRDYDYGSFVRPSDIAFVNSTKGYVMWITFEERFRAVGLIVKIGKGNTERARVQAFSNNTSVGNQTLLTPNFDGFIGFTDSRWIDRLDISAVNEDRGNVVRVDDIRFGDPVTDPLKVFMPIEWMPVGDARNRPDGTGFGRVNYNYRIAKHEVTNGQYAEFLNG